VSEVEGPNTRAILAHVLGVDRAWLIAHGDEVTLTAEQRRDYEALLARHSAGEPMAYITGEAWFYGRRFEVTPDVLIPRPETEHLVDDALEYLHAAHAREPEKNVTVLDAGTGSGAIAWTIAAEAPFCSVYATERSPAALEVARKNASCLVPRDSEGSEVRFELADLVPANASLRFDCVIANLPYVPTEDVPRKPDPVGFEPREALDGGHDGLREYRRLLAVLPTRANEQALILLEAAPPTIGALRDLAQHAFARKRVETIRDYGGLARYVRVVS
jgi:release factor glutamine methyltransferase